MAKLIALPAGATPLNELIPLPKGATPIDSDIDKKTGGNWKARMRVGGVNMKDKLATVKQHYPDAQLYGDDNILFTHPKTKRPTLLNPPGLDFGDVPGVAREIAETVGSGLGVAGAVALAPATLGTSLVTIPAAAGAGGATAGALYDASMEHLWDVPDSRSATKRVIDTGVDFGANAIGQRAGDLINAGAKNLAGMGYDAFARATAGRLADAASVGVDLPAGAATGSQVIQSAEQALANAPGSSSIIQPRMQQAVNQVDDAARNIASKIGSSPTKQEAGEVIVSGAKGAIDRFQSKQEVLYEKAYDLIGKDTPAFINSTQKLLGELQAELSAAPQSLAPHISGAIKQLENIVSDSLNGGGIPFAAWREIRTAIGRNLADPLGSGATSAQNAAQKRIYAALSDDMDLTARTGGELSEAASKALKKADRYTRYNKTRNIPLLEKLSKYEGEAEQALKFAMSGMRDGGSRLARMRRNLKPEEWDEVASHALANMGRGADGGSFSVAKFITSMTDKLSPGASSALFGGTRYKQIGPLIRRLVSTGKSLKDADKMANNSGTGRALAYMSLFGVFGGGGYASADTTGAAAGIATSILAPRYAAKLITSPTFMRWMTTSINKAVNPQGVTAQLAKLLAIGKGAPEIREEINQYISAVEEQN